MLFGLLIKWSIIYNPNYINKTLVFLSISTLHRDQSIGDVATPSNSSCFETTNFDVGQEEGLLDGFELKGIAGIFS